MRTAPLIAFVLTLLTLLPRADATVYYVRTSVGSDSNSGLTPALAWKSVTKALTSASAGDTVYIGAGTYSAALSSNKGLTLAGDPDGFFTSDAGSVIITAASGSTITLTGGTWTLSDLTVRQSATSGGSSSSIAITLSTGTFTLNNITIDQTGYEGIAISSGTVTINNSAISGHYSGGLDVSGGTVTVNATTFGAPAAGAVSSSLSSVSVANATLTLNRCRITGANRGVDMGSGTTLTLNNCLIDNNSADGIYAFKGTATLNYCTIASNAGSGINNTQNLGTINIYNSIIASNQSYGIYTKGTVTANRYLLWGNTTPSGTGGSGTLNSSNLTTTTPAFVDAANKDYRLSAGSNALAKADRTISANVYDDYLGLCRNISGANYDLGCYEYNSAAAQSVPYTQSFESSPGAGNYPGWTTGTRETNSGTTSILGRFAGNSGWNNKVGHTLTLTTTPGTSYCLLFDLLAFDSWDTETFEVMIDGQSRLSRTITYANTGSAQTTTLPWAAESNSTNLGGTGGWSDAIYRQVPVRFTASGTTTNITFRSTLDQAVTDESWALDNVSVSAFSWPSAPYTEDFTTAPGPEWGGYGLLTTNATNALAGRFLGSMGLVNSNAQTQAAQNNNTANGGTNRGFATLNLSTTIGQTYYVVFDLLVMDSWDGADTAYGPDAMNVDVNGVVVFNHTFQNWARTYNQSYPPNPDERGTIAGVTGTSDAIYRKVFFSFTATTAVTRLTWRGMEDTIITDESWGLENIAVVAAGDTNIFNYLPRFRDVTASRGTGSIIASTNASIGGSVHIADLNNDGYPDLIITGDNQSRVCLYDPATKTYTVSTLGAGNTGGAGVLLDYNADGCMDFFGFGSSLSTQNFYRNTGAGAFFDAGSLSFTAPANRFACAGVDLNNDGYTDIAQFDRNGANNAALFTAGSTPTFPNSTTVFPQGSANAGSGNYVCSADLNNDGYPDFFYAYSAGRLFTSTGSGTFSVTSQPFSVNNTAVQGGAWGDINNDNKPDLFFSNMSASPYKYLFVASGSSSYTDYASTLGTSITDGSMARPTRSGCWGDYDLSGRQSLYLVGSTGNVLVRTTGIASGVPSFARGFEGVGTDQVCYDACFADLDNDGDLDLVVVTNNGVRIYENLTNDVLGTNRSLKVRVLNGSRADTRARVELYSVTSGIETFVARRDIGAARGMGGEEPFIAHFGGVTPSGNYRVKVYSGSLSATVDCIPSSATTTIGGNTLSQTLTVSLGGSGLKITKWMEVSP